VTIVIRHCNIVSVVRPAQIDPSQEGTQNDANLLLAAVLVCPPRSPSQANTATAVHTFTCKGDQPAADWNLSARRAARRFDSRLRWEFLRRRTGFDGRQLHAERGNGIFGDARGTFKLLHTFAPGANNDYPNGNFAGQLIEGPDGRLYGVTCLAESMVAAATVGMEFSIG